MDKHYGKPKYIRNLNTVNAWQEIAPLLPIYKPVDLGFVRLIDKNELIFKQPILMCFSGISRFHELS